MNSTFTLKKGRIGMLISMPHNGEAIPDIIAKTMTPVGKAVADTDWYMDKLYDFANAMGIYIIQPKYSRYVIDLNRDVSGVNLYPGANSTELCPTTAFDLSPLYLEGHNPSEEEVERRIETYWKPYHQAVESTIAQLKEQYGKVVLLDAHSILSEVPRFFEGSLPDFNFGSVCEGEGTSCSPEMVNEVMDLNFSPYSKIRNGRFKGGFITRAYGNPKNNVHALQLELSQATYMDESSNYYNLEKAEQVKKKILMLVQCLATFAQR
jgi:N-formylglutamate deformylase